MSSLIQGLLDYSMEEFHLNNLNTLNTSGFLDTYSYSGIIGLYNAGVPVEFLKILEDRNMLDDMSYSEVIQAYNADN
ncbi:MAG: hypothetical protein BalsKO_09760 [Balneolaceae bacterium]